ncbi:hydroxymethylglutaryl-CoA lyase [Bradyrhizobium sp. CCBAU 51745]|uniref:hydroxymethylglutaryl-CoA lyase n=1 Tax=Bradyrhizobium sp. CCBAU 51745 TaxID=1325099 RepID=UPI0023065C6A|nr:hydroxymethylglutaryl-CoA lyase [Bradyrhizobium sp. CCBAU 51745]MDA9438868.1 hydroxymethylglutaryl-CoA lyase [Bradyrhizobium sp. CCBAU 51745]
MSAAPPHIVIQEVAPRDGLQIEPKWVETPDKIKLIDSLSAIGFARIEVSSFVSPAAVPALRDAAEVFAGVTRRPGTVYTALIPNRRGAELALAARADELNFVMSASETHNRANMNMTHARSLAALAEIAELAHEAGALLNATIATAFGCPFEGAQPFSKVLDIVERYLAVGVDGITLADTTGMANPNQLTHLVSAALRLVPADELTLHFHNTRGLGLVNALAAYDAGARRFDAALGGLGGCPFAPGATGNICTEDFVNLCHEIGLATGLKLHSLIDLSRRLPELVGHEVPGQVAKAGRACDLYPLPERLRGPG